MRVLITGVDGFTAGYMAELLLRCPGVEVHGTYRKKRQVDTLPFPKERLHLHEADVRDAAALAALCAAVKPERIIHIAGRGSIPDSFTDPAQTYAANVAGSVNVFEAARLLRDNQGIAPAIVFAGAGQVYSAENSNGHPLTEETALGPVNPYTTSKACVDLIARDYRRSFGMDIVITRPFNHIGPRQPDRFVCADFARRIALIAAGRASREFKAGPMDMKRDFTDVRDVVRAYWLLLEKRSEYSVFNICSGIAVQISEILDLLQEISGVTVKVVMDRSKIRKNDLPVIVGSYARLHETTGWTPEIPLRQTLEEMYHYWLDTIRRTA